MEKVNFKLTKQLVERISEAIDNNEESFLIETLSEMHPADIAEVFDELSLEQARLVYKFLDSDKASDVLIELEEDVRNRFLESLSSKEIADTFIENLESDDAADILSSLSEKKMEEVIAQIDDIERASNIVDLLSYEEGTAGALMGKELIKVEEDWTVVNCVREMRKQAENLDYVYAIYVVDKNNKLLGTLQLKKLLVTPSKVKISDIYNPLVHSVKASTSSDEVADIMEKYDLVSLPVIDELQRLIGRITIDDVVDVIKEEAERDYNYASGISESIESTDSIWQLTRARLPWLVIGLLGGIIAARIIGVFESNLTALPQLAFFIPLIAAMGGNVGVQSSAIVVQGLANNTLGFGGIFSQLTKEFIVALGNGIALAALVVGASFLFYSDIKLSLTVGIALFSVIIFASIIGTSIPMILNKFNINPALATGPFITTTNDIVGLLVYFSVGNILYS